MLISLIVAASTNNAIGKANELLWHLPIDLKFFKNTTWAMPVIMGRKTFESVGSKPLPGRQNIIISKQEHTSAYNNVSWATSITDAIEQSKKLETKEIFIAGGSQIYEQSMDEILSSNFFIKSLPNSWKKSLQQGKPRICAKTCGKEVDLFRAQFQEVP